MSEPCRSCGNFVKGGPIYGSLQPGGVDHFLFKCECGATWVAYPAGGTSPAHNETEDPKP